MYGKYPPMTYDSQADAAYAYLTDKPLMPGRGSVPVDPPDGVDAMVVLDWKDGVVGLEILEGPSFSTMTCSRKRNGPPEHLLPARGARCHADQEICSGSAVGRRSFPAGSPRCSRSKPLCVKSPSLGAPEHPLTAGRSVVVGPGVTGPKSRPSGCRAGHAGLRSRS